jgi:polyvinyl alcohol dehydrogenase (cytochrome)
MKTVTLLLASAIVLCAQDGAALYKEICASCHEGGADRAPSREALRAMTPDRVLTALESGVMVTMTSRRTAAERRAIAEFVTGKSLSQKLETGPRPEAMCREGAGQFTLTGPTWNGWGQNAFNTRFQDAAAAKLTAAQVPRLKLKWAFGFPGELISNGQASIVGGRVYVGSAGGTVYSLDAASGCIHWYFQAASGVRSGISVGRIGDRNLAFFGDLAGTAYAVDAATGKQVWKIKVDDYPVARITGSPTLYNGRLYVPVASGEEGAGAAPDYQCCKFRGSVVALDAATGRQIWKTYTIDPPKPTKKNKQGTQLWAPSGAPVWTAPAIDTKRNALYVTTGDNYSDPASRTSDAFMAMDLDSGKILWSRQMTPSDSYNVGCRMPDTTNCPESNGPDLDFGASAILVTLPNGKRELVAGQKSGVVHAVDPDNQGEVIWQTRVGHGGSMGGIQWGSATDQANVYVALSDIGRVRLTYSQNTDADPKTGGGMFALRLTDGKQIWHTPPGVCNHPRCSPAQSAAVSAIPGIAFSGSVDGHMRAYSTVDGKIVWDLDTIAPYKTVNGVEGHGGSLDGPGPAIAGGVVLINSGYPTAGGTPGNVLLAFTVDGK